MKSTTAVIALSALAQNSRLAVFRLLVEQGPTGLTPGEISEQLELPSPTLSFHLKELNSAGLLTAEQNGRSIIYAVNFATMRELVEFLYQNCCGVGVAGCGPECLPALDVQLTSPKVRSLRSKK